MIEQVKAYMEQWNMVAPGDMVYAGVSGGADSVCMLLVLSELAGEFPFTLKVVHVEHGIRGEESRKDAAFVEKLCRQLGLPLKTVSVDVPSYAKREHLGMEEAARMLRYQAFSDLASGGENVVVALAHHMEDNAETMLFQMIRGSGIDGMCGIRPRRIDENGTCYIRPLLGCSREEIEHFLERRGQTFCTDQTNGDVTYSRNRIRSQILPKLAQINPRAVLHMNRAAEDLGKLRDMLDALADQAQPAVIHPGKQQVALDTAELMKLPEAVRMRLIQRAFAMVSGTKKDLARVHLQAVDALLQMQTGRRIDLPGGLWATRSYGEILFSGICGGEELTGPYEITGQMLQTLAEEGFDCLTVVVKNIRFELRIFPWKGKIGEIPQKMYTKWMDYDKIKDGFSIRSRKPKDYFIMDDNGHSKKLSDYFITEKIPADRRDDYVLLAQESQILWIVGGRMGKTAMVDPTTKQILEITAEKISPINTKGGASDGLQQKA